MSLPLLGDMAVTPFLAGIAGVGLMIGTVVGQSGYDKASTDDNNPMAGMNMGSGSSMSSMPGMGAGSTTAAAPAPDSAGTMKMPDGSSMPAASMPMGSKPMNMTDPNMAAAMPGGLHTTCSAQECTVVFAPTATGVAKVLDTTAKLDSAKAKQIVLTVGKRKLTLHQGKPVTDGKLRIELTGATSQEYTVEFTRIH
jgi:hypothetical protein